MKKNELITQIKLLLGKNNVLLNEPMSRHTTFKIGGPADIFVTPEKFYIMAKLINLLNNNSIPYFIIGKGSNLVVSDKGIRGIVISTTKMIGTRKSVNKIFAACGTELSDVCKLAANSGLSGLEFACGIPGTVGGAVYMNAGAYGGEIQQVLLFSKVLDTSIGVVKTIPAVKHDFSYRHSIFQDEKYILLSSAFSLKPQGKDEIKAKMDELTKSREDKQPLELPSAGSVFRRPEGHYTGKLIEECGLRGFRIGGAEVSTKHCGFIVNIGNATAQDVKDLVKHIQKTVLEKFGVSLQTEIKFVGAE